jgi:integral membrane sensor domain MASE1
MKMLPQVLFWLGLISIPFAWLVWYFGSEIEIIRPVLASINDPALRAAHAERLGIWVAVWPVSFLVLSQILEKKMQG